MRPAIRDSLISGQPLNLLYSNWKRGAPAPRARLVASLLTHATGRVRLQVTASPPTASELGLVPAQPAPSSGTPSAARPCMTRRRDIGGAAADCGPGGA